MREHAFSGFTGFTQLEPVELWDGRRAMARIVAGLPAFRWRWAPSGLATRRQLREMGLRPAGQEPYALLLWRRDERFAYLYRTDLAAPKREATPAQLAAIGKALAARRTCPLCHVDAGYCLPTSDGRCVECIAARRMVPVDAGLVTAA